MVYPQSVWNTVLPASIDISGAPSIVVGPSDEVYFTCSIRGSMGSLNPLNAFGVVVGCYSSSGSLQWIFQDPKLYSATADTQPSIALGSSGELYVAYVTVGATPGNKNATDIFTLCGGCGSLRGPEDIVVARIDGATSGTPSVAWVLQDLNLNSCSRETSPKIVFDSFASRILLAYTTTGSTLCTNRVGTPNVIVAAIAVDGGLLWGFQNASVNCPTQNSSPSVTFDSSGNIYVAYKITSTVDGGSYVGGSSDIEVIRLHTEGSPTYVIRDWILSHSTIINTNVADTDPSIVWDPVQNCLYLAFCTEGTVPGGTHTAASVDIVVASLTVSGTLKWILQSPEFNEASYRYSSIETPTICVDAKGVIYIAARAISASTGNRMILLFSFVDDTFTHVSNWKFTCGSTNYRAYIPAGLEYAPRSILFNTGAVYSSPCLAVRSGNLYLGFNIQDTHSFFLLALNQVEAFADISAFDYLNKNAGICGACTD